MNKPLSYVNFSFELHVASTFWFWSYTSGTFSLNFAQQSYELQRPALKMHILWCRTNICRCKLSTKVSLMLDNPFPVPYLCKLNHINLSFIHISTNITCKQLILFRESHVFFELIPGVLGHSVNFIITQRFLLRQTVFQTIFDLWLQGVLRKELSITPSTEGFKTSILDKSYWWILAELWIIC